METLETRMMVYKDGPDGPMATGELPPMCLECGKTEIIWITHDESTFYPNEGMSFFWMENGKKKILPKTKGSSIMISGFMCPCHGFMSAMIDGRMIRSYTVFHCGTNRDGWFTNADLVKQLDDCAALFKHLHPDKDIHVFFDNSMTHRARAPDGLDASKLNLSDGGANVTNLRPGWFMRTDVNGIEVRVEQPMQTENGIQKGLRTILTERGKFKNDQGHNLCKVSRPCLDKTPHSERENRTQKCCAFYVLSQEPDFRAQKPWLQEEVEKHGFHIHFYPKYHCELNWIEMIWGWVKSCHRRNCTYSFADLDGNDGLTKTLNERIPLAFVRRVARHSLRYMHFYRVGLEGPELEFAVKKYKGHRSISAAQKEEIKVAFEEYCTKHKR
jgi:hypothetical protein